MPRRSTTISLTALLASLSLGAAVATAGAALADSRPSRVDAAAATHSAHSTTAQTPASHAKRCPLNALLVPKCGVLFGAYVKPQGSQSSEQAFTSLQHRTGSHLRVLHFYHGGTQLFPSRWEMSQSRHGHRLLLNWKPETGHTWAQVASGASDSYIKREAAYLRQNYSRKKFFLVIHHEPEEEVRDSSGSGYTASDYAAMFRHVENVLKANGVRNAVYVMCYMGAEVHTVKSWYSDLWPGNAYVDWIAFDRYSAPPMTPASGNFKTLVNRHYGHGSFHGAYRWARSNYPHKPVMLAEWGASESASDPGWKARMFGTVTPNLRSMPNLKLISYFDSPGDKGQDKSVDTSAASMRAWQRLAAKPIFHRRR
jgi:hypothetical protein